MKCGGVLESTGEAVPGLAANVILDRSLQYCIYAMTMDQSQIPSLALIQEKAKSMLVTVGKSWVGNNDMYRKAILLFITENQSFVLSDKFSCVIKDFEKILLFIKKNRIGESTYSKDKARGREELVGLSPVEISRIESAARPLLTAINNGRSYEKMKKFYRPFDPNVASEEEVALHSRFPDYIPSVLMQFLDTPEKMEVFKEWHDKIFAKLKD